MARMTRTQITLEEDEYLFLKSRAAETGDSLSAVVRHLVRARMSAEQSEPPLHIWELAGILGDCEYTDEDHETLIYKSLCAELGLDPDEKEIE